jgi:hypothetical protein
MEDFIEILRRRAESAIRAMVSPKLPRETKAAKRAKRAEK